MSGPGAGRFFWTGIQLDHALHDMTSASPEDEFIGVGDSNKVLSPTISVEEEETMRVYIDMDNVLVDFQSGIDKLDEATRRKYAGKLDEVPSIFSKMEPMDGAIKAFEAIADEHDVFILSTAPWGNPSAWSDKLNWVKEHLGPPARKRLILSHHKYLVQGDVLIDDRRKRGAGAFSGRHIHFGHDHETNEAHEFPTWESVLRELDAIS